jgi:hypothetical protein
VLWRRWILRGPWRRTGLTLRSLGRILGQGLGRLHCRRGVRDILLVFILRRRSLSIRGLRCRQAPETRRQE